MRPRFFIFGAILLPLALPLTTGCVFLQKPPNLPKPTAVPTPVRPVFEATDGTNVVSASVSAGNTAKNTTGIALNSATDTSKPVAFRALPWNLAKPEFQRPDLLVLAPVYADPSVPAGTPLPTGQFDYNNPVRLAGIVVPQRGTRGYAEAMQAVQNWAVNPRDGLPRDLDVTLDPVFPTDTEGHRLVQVFFNVNTGTKEEPIPGKLLLNRMLVRAGWAVVDLYSPTSFDQKSWLFDETYARTHTLVIGPGGKPYADGRLMPDGKIVLEERPLKQGEYRRPDPLGLWKYGIALQQRIPVSSTGTGSQSRVVVQGGVVPTATPRPLLPGEQSVANPLSREEIKSSLLPPPNAAPPAPAPGAGAAAAGND